ncbi:hypothetical protein [Saccharospirillum impatiens]|uniref:hypothetical protein n=1 Tax=Saccharospirillum impatiens TaxID=169438 RepID=UPI0006848ECC|nr:hypothetical protein [Saccharospirillum impatiens]
MTTSPITEPLQTAPWADHERLPGLTPRAASRLRQCLEHPDAPQFSGRSGHRLSAQAIRQLQADKAALQQPDLPWLTAFLARCRQQVPHYRAYPWHAGFVNLPCSDRNDLSQDIAAFVPDDIDPAELIAYETSGTTGHPLTVPSLPLVAARYHCFHERILSWHGIDLQSLPGTTGVMLVGDQQRCFTYASVLPYWDDKVLLKTNLNPADWPTPEARGRYIDACKPQLITGDPRSLSTLLSLDFNHRPAAILSTSMTLLGGLKDRLAARFQCPVINLYSMNEAGPIAADDGSGQGLRLVQSAMTVEILDRQGHPVSAPNGRGEITLTGGFNPCLPLLRYRTGDYACLVEDDQGRRYLRQLDGRPPVRYKTVRGWLNNVDITHLLQPFGLAQYQLHQDQQGGLTLTVVGDPDHAALASTLGTAFGTDCPIRVGPLQTDTDKLIQYTSHYPGAHDG